MVAVWFVDPMNGSDSRDGDTREGAFLTTAAANTALTAGDTVKIIPSGDFRGVALAPTKQATWQVDGYEPGTDLRVRFLGSVQKTGFAYDSANRWGVASATDPLTVSFVTSAGIWLKGTRKLSKAAVTAALDWFWEVGTTTLWVFSPPDADAAAVDPLTNYSAVEAGSLATPLCAPSGVNGLVFWGLSFRGAASSGFNSDGVTSELLEDCDFGFNSEDGFGGNNVTGSIARRVLAEYNGTIRPANLAAVLSDGDGHSKHGTSSYLIEDSLFRGNLKSAVNSVQSAGGTVRRCRSEGCNLNFVAGTAGPATIFEHCLAIMAADDIGGFGMASAGTLIGCGAYGGGPAVGTGDNNTGFTFYDVGAVTAKDCWAVNCKVAVNRTVLGFGGAFVERRFGVYGNGTDAVGFTLHASKITADPLFRDVAANDFRLQSASPYLLAGVDCTGLVTATDLDGKVRPAGAWDVGPYQAPSLPRELVIAAVLNALGTIRVDDGDWRMDRQFSEIDRTAPDERHGRIDPYAFLDKIGETIEYSGSHGADDIRHRVMSMEIVVLSDGWAVRTEPSKIVHDIELALADHTLGGAADTLMVKGSRETVRDGRCAVIVPIEVVFRTKRLDPSQRA